MTRRTHLNGSRILPKSVVGYIHNHATKNYWRVASYYELDDLIQDGLMKAYECLDRYGEPGVDIDPPHFMALVKTAFYRHIAEILRHSRAEQENVKKIGDAAGEMSETDYLDKVAEPVAAMQELAAFVAKMPEALRKAVMLYLNRPEIMRNGDERSILKKLAGFPTRFDFQQALRAYIWEAEHLENA